MSDADWYAAEQERIVRATELFKTTEERALAAEARAARYEEALIRCAEIAGVDGEAVEAARSGAMKQPPLEEWAVLCVQDLRDDYDASSTWAPR